MRWFRFCDNRSTRTLSESEKRQYMCAFTGHRPEKVVGSEGKIIVELRKEIMKAIDEGYRVFLTGMTLGTALFGTAMQISVYRGVTLGIVGGGAHDAPVIL